MNLLRSGFAAVLMACSTFLGAHAQSSHLLSFDSLAVAANGKKPATGLKNIAKFNLAGLAVRNYSFQYESVIGKRIAVALSYRLMPEGKVPFKETLLDVVTDDADTRDALQNAAMKGSAITPELRYYMGKKGFGKGLYLAPFFRSARFKASGVKVDFEGLRGQMESIRLSGDGRLNSAGLLLGAQWMLKKNLVLDWWMLGPHYGAAKASFTGIPSKALSNYEQQQLRDKLEDLDVPLLKKEITVTANEALIKLNGPWGGVRAGLSLGVRF